MRRLRPVLVSLLAVLALALAGCGSSGSSDAKRSNAYVDKVNTAQTEFARSVTSLSGRITSGSSAGADRATMRSFTSAIDRVVRQLRAIDPPDKVKALHAQLVQALGTYEGAIRDASADLGSGNADKLLAAQQELLKATSTVTSQINTTINAINDKLHS